MIQVLKFGGTTLNSNEKLDKIARIVSDKLKNDIFPILIVSAPGRRGEPYATDTLGDLISKNNKREYARCVSCGEIISASVVADKLLSNNIKSISVTTYQTGIYANDKNVDAKIEKIDFAYLQSLIEKKIIPVIAGFQAVNKKGEIAVLERGGTDLSAVAIAVGLNADIVEIYKEFDGIYTADPNIVKNSKRIDKIDFGELFELSAEGVKVVSKDAADLSDENKIPMVIKSLEDNSKGTKIHYFKKKRSITAITSKKDIVFVSISTTDKYSDLDVFSYISEFGISADFIDIRDTKITFITDIKFTDKLKEILNYYNFDFKIFTDYVKISLVGAGMTGIPGVMAKIISALKSENIALIQTTDSHTTISCLIFASDHDKALKTLHKKFFGEDND